MRPERVAGLEQPGDAGMIFQDRPQPAREHLDLRCPAQGAAGPGVDLGQHPVRDEVAELLLAAHVPVQSAGDDAEAGGEAAHAQGIHAVGGNDGEGLGDDSFAGQRTAAALLAIGWAEP